jgi:hypothetical protein
MVAFENELHRVPKDLSAVYRPAGMPLNGFLHRIDLLSMPEGLLVTCLFRLVHDLIPAQPTVRLQQNVGKNRSLDPWVSTSEREPCDRPSAWAACPAVLRTSSIALPPGWTLRNALKRSHRFCLAGEQAGVLGDANHREHFDKVR